MIYTWECPCGNRTEVNRPVSQYRREPDEVCNQCGFMYSEKIIGVTPVMFEKAYDSGVFERTWKHPNLS